MITQWNIFDESYWQWSRNRAVQISIEIDNVLTINFKLHYSSHGGRYEKKTNTLTCQKSGTKGIELWAIEMLTMFVCWRYSSTCQTPMQYECIQHSYGRYHILKLSRIESLVLKNVHILEMSLLYECMQHSYGGSSFHNWKHWISRLKTSIFHCYSAARWDLPSLRRVLSFYIWVLYIYLA